MNVFADIRDLVTEHLGAMVAEGRLPRGLPLASVAVESPHDPAHGDVTTNAAVALAGRAGLDPREIAADLAGRLALDPRIEGAGVGGEGFVNLRLAPAMWTAALSAVLERGESFGSSDLGMRRRVNVEFASAYPTGPIPAGHLRGAVHGDALASVLAFAGHEVTREYYCNDGGPQADALARAAYRQYLAALGRVEAPAEGDALAPVGRALAERVGEAWLDAPEEVWLDEARAFATGEMMAAIRDDLAALGIEMDVVFSERSLHGTGRIEAAIDALDERGLIYEGRVDGPGEAGASRQRLFRSTARGDDADRPVVAADGGWTYFAPDIAYHHDKIGRGFDALALVLPADHGAYAKRIRAVVAALSDGQVPIDVAVMRPLRPLRDGELLGSVPTLREVVDELGPDLARFAVLRARPDAPLDLDLARAREPGRDNPAFRVQHAGARAHGVLQHALEAGHSTSEVALGEGDLSTLSHEAEVAVLRRIAGWPHVVEGAARDHDPHRVALYLDDLAGDLDALRARGEEDPSLSPFQDDPAAARPKLALLRAGAIVIGTGLRLLGVEPMEAMS